MIILDDLSCFSFLIYLTGIHVRKDIDVVFQT